MRKKPAAFFSKPAAFFSKPAAFFLKPAGFFSEAAGFFSLVQRLVFLRIPRSVRNASMAVFLLCASFNILPYLSQIFLHTFGIFVGDDFQ